MKNKEINTPEQVPEPSVTDRIVDTAIDLVDEYAGQADKDEFGAELSRAVFYVPDNESGDGRYPSLAVAIPKEGVASRYQWRAELTFGNQGSRLSSHVLIKKDGTIAVSDYTEDSRETALTDEQVQALTEYLEEIRPNLIPDM